MYAFVVSADTSPPQLPAMAPPYTVAPHLEYFAIPLAEFTSARPEFETFGVGGYIFSEDADLSSETGPASPRLLLLQRAPTDSMPGCWEGPGGASEPDTDITLLDGVAREVLEETGLHVSRIVELVAVDSWTHTSRTTGARFRIAKYSFLIEVYESMRQSPDGSPQPVPREEIPVRLEASAHQACDWATEEDVRHSVQTGQGKYKFPESWIAQKTPEVLHCFELFREYRRKATWYLSR